MSESNPAKIVAKALCIANGQAECFLDTPSCLDTGCQGEGKDFMEDAHSVIAALEREGFKLPTGRKKPPAERVTALKKKLYTGEELRLAERLIALWYIHEREGWPEVDKAEEERLEQLLRDAAPSYATTPVETEVVDGVIKSVTVKNSGAGFMSPPDSKKPASA